MDDLKRHLREAHGYIELGMFEEGARALEEIDPKFKALPDVLAMSVLLYREARNWALLEVVAQHLAKVQSQEVGWWVDWAFAARRVEGVEQAKKSFRKNPSASSGEAPARSGPALQPGMLRLPNWED